MPDIQQRPQEAPAHDAYEPERELPMLAGIAELLHWFEELLNIVNGPVLLAGMFIALIDLLTDGKLTATAPMLLYVWAGSQALGIDGQLMGSWARVSRARGWKLLGWLIVGVVLGVAAWQAGFVFAVQQTEGISEAAALAQLRMPAETWLGWRMFLAVGLIALHAITRYRKPAKVKTSLEDERAELERELTLEPLRQALRARQVGGLRTLAEAALRGAGAAMPGPVAPSAPPSFEPTERPPAASQDGSQAASPPPPDASSHTSHASHGPDEQPNGDNGDGNGHRPPTGPGSPAVSPAVGSNRRGKRAPQPEVLRLPSLPREPRDPREPRPQRQSKRVAARANAKSGGKDKAEQKIRAALASVPDLDHLDFDDLVARTGVSRSSASKWIAVIRAERAAEQAAQ